MKEDEAFWQELDSEIRSELGNINKLRGEWL